MKKTKLLGVLTAAALAFAFISCANSSSDGNNNNNKEENTLPEGVIEFGEFPQSIIADGVTVDKGDRKQVGDFIYYKGSDGAWYVEGSYNNYFKVEKIQWKKLTDDYNETGKKLYLATKVLFPMPFYDGATFKVVDEDTGTQKKIRRTIKGEEVLNSNYLYSTIHAYLNGKTYEIKDRDEVQSTVETYANSGFINTAFNLDEKSKLKEAEIDYLLDDKTSGKMKAKVFLLSLAEVNNADFGFTDDASRKMESTDYDANELGTSQWWLRTASPVQGSETACYIPLDGSTSVLPITINVEAFGLVPAIVMD